MTEPSQVNRDGLTKADVATAYEVLEVLREELSNEKMDSKADKVNEVHYLLQQYEETTTWRDPKPADSIDSNNHQPLENFTE